MKNYSKQFNLIQKAEILDKEKRIIRVKASDGNFDRDLDRININSWRTPGYNPPLVDSHKTSDTMDRRLGEIINAFAKDGFYWNDIQLDIPQGEPNEWTQGEKLSNRLWKLALAEKDLSFSVGFIPDEQGMTRNNKGGIDFNGQEQTELSFVLIPSNARAGNKEMGGEKMLLLENSLENLLLKKIKEATNKENRICVNAIYVNEVVFNSWGYEVEGDDSTWYDKYFRTNYAVVNSEVALVGEIKEVMASAVYVDKSKNKYETKELLESEFKDLLAGFKKDILEDLKVIKNTAVITKSLEEEVKNKEKEAEKIDIKKMIDEIIAIKIKTGGNKND
jgi:hypothetical protein